MTVTPVNDGFQPTVVPGAGTTTYDIGTPAVVVAPAIVVTHPDLPYFTGATVAIVDHVATDVLGFTLQPGITGSYSGATGILTLSGTASPAAYQLVLRSVTFRAVSNPGNTNIAFTVTDGTRTVSANKALTVIP